MIQSYKKILEIESFIVLKMEEDKKRLSKLREALHQEKQLVTTVLIKYLKHELNQEYFKYRVMDIDNNIADILVNKNSNIFKKYIAEKDTRIATIPIGYADGIPRLIGNKKGFVIIKGQKVPIVGNVCMDMLMADLGEIPAKEGDEVIIFNSCKTLEEFAEYCQTIPYEVLTSISRRVKRIYIKD